MIFPKFVLQFLVLDDLIYIFFLDIFVYCYVSLGSYDEIKVYCAGIKI